MKSIRKLFRRDDRGSALVEFGLIAPVLVSMVIGIGDGALLTYNYSDMRSAVLSGAQYVMGGGRSTTAAQSVVLSAWTTRNNSSSVSVNNACTCAGGSSGCGNVCPDGTVPKSFTTVSATMTYQGLFFVKPISASQIVRIR